MNVLYTQKRTMTKGELCKCGTFPQDYDFKKSKPAYLIGMSVPPVMKAKIAERIYNQWLNNQNKNNE
jgi:DNA (cytosine-5)-methyltransferase 1